MKKFILIIIIILGVLIMLKPVSAIIKDSIANIMYRGNVVTGTVAVVNGDGSYDVFISESDVAYPKIFTLSANPNLAVGDKVRILYKGGCKELPIILPPSTAAEPEIVMFENQIIYLNTNYSNLANPDHRYGMPILAISDHNVTQVHVFCKRFGSPGTVNVKIYAADANKKPTGEVLSSGNFDGDTLEETGAWKEIDVSLCTFSEGNWYVIVFDVPGAGSWHYFRWYGKFTNVYPDAVGVYSNNAGVTWSYTFVDFTFKIYGY